jgi:predicted ATPase
MARISSSDTDPEKIGKLQSLLQDYDEQTIALFADLLGINPGTRYLPLNIGATEKRHLTINALKAWCASYAEHAPLLLCFEDVQWIDPTSKLLLTQLTEWVKTARVLLVITIRAGGSMAASLLQDAGNYNWQSRNSALHHDL